MRSGDALKLVLEIFYAAQLKPKTVMETDYCAEMSAQMLAAIRREVPEVCTAKFERIHEEECDRAAQAKDLKRLVKDLRGSKLDRDEQFKYVVTSVLLIWSDSVQAGKLGLATYSSIAREALKQFLEGCLEKQNGMQVLKVFEERLHKFLFRDHRFDAPGFTVMRSSHS